LKLREMDGNGMWREERRREKMEGEGWSFRRIWALGRKTHQHMAARVGSRWAQEVRRAMHLERGESIRSTDGSRVVLGCSDKDVWVMPAATGLAP
jgi:hypothetical protein